MSMYDDFEQFVNLDDTKETYTTNNKCHMLIINSKDRNMSNDTCYNFSINFNSLNEKVLNINKNFKNITSIQFMGIIIPNIYLDIEEVLSLYNKELITTNGTAKYKKLMRISDLPYLLLNISEIKNKDTYGSNNHLNKSSFVLVLDDTNVKTNNNSGSVTISGTSFTENGNISDTIFANTDKRVVYLKDISLMPINYYSSPQSYLSNLEISITTPEGKLLSNLNNYLECSIIKSDHETPSNATKLTLIFSKFFCSDEYPIGDKIIFKDIDISDTSYSDLKNFLLREDGHTILGIGGKGSSTTATKLYSEIDIPYEYTINLSVSENAEGDSIIKNNFNLSNVGISITGKAFNLSLQSVFSLKITNEERDENKLHSHIN